MRPTMPAPLVIPLPADIDDETAAAIFLKGLAVEFMFHTIRPIRAGEIVLVRCRGRHGSPWRGHSAPTSALSRSDDKAERPRRRLRPGDRLHEEDLRAVLGLIGATAPT
jgi:hypothetical protein